MTSGFALPQWADAVRSAVQPTVDAAQAKYDPGHEEDTLSHLRTEFPG